MALASVAMIGQTASALPSGTTPVKVTAGAVTANIDAQLKPAASISGTIKFGSKPVPEAYVFAYRGGKDVGTGFSDSTGAYTVTGLLPGSGYTVCIGSSNVGGPSATGVLPRCYKNTSWTLYGKPPRSAVTFPLAGGQHKTGVNVSLPAGAAIAGTVTRKSNGSGVNEAYVYLMNRNTKAVSYASTNAKGHYSAIGLTTASRGYTVCVLGSYASGPTGLLDQCYKGASWHGGGYPSSAKAVSVTAGKTHGAVNAVLANAGAVAGTVVSAKTGKPVSDAYAVAVTATGRYLEGSATNSKGQYRIRGLVAATSDRICVTAGQISPTVSYKGLCYKQRSWSGRKPPATAAAVKVTTGKTHGGINFKVTQTTIRLGSIAGKITANSSGVPLETQVDLYVAGSQTSVTSVYSRPSGAYKFTDLPASSRGYVVCAESQYAQPQTGSVPANGWAPRCYKTATWDGATVPKSVTKLVLKAGQNRTGVNIALGAGGSISGSILAAGTTTGLNFVQADVYDSAGRIVQEADTVAGAYKVSGLAPSGSGYTVCFNGRYDTTDTSSSGYQSQCWKNVGWNPN